MKELLFVDLKKKVILKFQYHEGTQSEKIRLFLPVRLKVYSQFCQG